MHAYSPLAAGMPRRLPWVSLRWDLPSAEAEKAWHQLLALKPASAEYVQGLAILYLRTGRSEEAKRLIRETNPTKSVVATRTETVSDASVSLNARKSRMYSRTQEFKNSRIQEFKNQEARAEVRIAAFLSS